MRARILRSPLLHFVVVGAGLFALALGLDPGGARDVLRRPTRDAAGDRGEPGRGGGDGSRGEGCEDPIDSDTIRVGREALLGFIQSRTRMPRLEDAAAAFDAADPDARRDWTERFVREEALVREARRLGLDRSDELVRRRLVQQMEFLVEDVGEGALSVGEEEIVAAYHAKSEVDAVAPMLRFAHVFVREPFGDSARVGERKALEGQALEREVAEGQALEREALGRAEAMRDELDRRRIPFDGAFAWGDRFPYDRVYVDRALDEVRSHFGDAFAEALMRLEPAPERWVGPIRSSHGLHLVLLVARTPARPVTLDEARPVLRDALLREKRARAVERGVDAIVERYRVELEDGLDGASLRSGGRGAESTPVRAPGSSADSRHSIAPPPAS